MLGARVEEGVEQGQRHVRLVGVQLDPGEDDCRLPGRALLDERRQEPARLVVVAATECVATGVERVHRVRGRIRPSWAVVATSVPSCVKTRPSESPRAPCGRRRPLVVEPPLVGAERPVEPDVWSSEAICDLGRVDVVGCQGRAEQGHVAGVGEGRKVLERVVGQPLAKPDPDLGLREVQRVGLEAVAGVAEPAHVERGPLLAERVGLGAALLHQLDQVEARPRAR